VTRGLRSRLRPTVPALVLVAGLALSGCGGSSSDEQSAPASGSGHGDHAGAPPAEVEGPDERFKGFDLAEPYRRPSFTLTDTTGAPFDFKAQTAGRPTLLFFGYTNCPDICPTTMADVSVALRSVDPAIAEEVQVVFVTTDPGFDTPEVLGKYLAQFDADLPVRYVGLTGEQDAIEQAQLSAGVPLAEDDGRAHSALLLLYGQDDAARVAFDSENTSRDIADDLAVVVG
jgi:protein SCO1